MSAMDQPVRRPTLEITMELFMGEFSAVKRASMIERLELALEQNEGAPLETLPDPVLVEPTELRLARWREDDLQVALGIASSIFTDEQADEFQRRYDLERVPPPPGFAVE